jgi:hypothetical protein
MIIVDTREQKPWDFTFYGHEVVFAKLDYGDYSVQGKTDQVFIERKANTSELSNNLCTDDGYRRFNAEMKRAGEARKIIICEFPESHMESFPEKSGIPVHRHKFVRIGAKFLRKRLHEIVERYSVEVYFNNTVAEAEELALKILSEYI